MVLKVTLSGHQGLYFVVLGKAPGLLFGVFERTVDGDVENAAAAADQLDLGLGFLPLDDIPRTEGPRFVVSLYAVFDLDLHGIPVAGARRSQTSADFELLETS